jgi:FkbM family methyltransferase
MKTLLLTFSAALFLMVVGADKGSCAEVVGTVTDLAGGFISGAVIIAKDSSGKALGRTLSNLQGHYELVGLAPGRHEYFLKVSQLGFKDGSAVAVLDTKDLTIDWKVSNQNPAVAMATEGTRSDKATHAQFAVAAVRLLAPAKLYAFEPIPEVCARLKKNTARVPQVHTAAMALGEAAGRREFHRNSHSHSSSILSLGRSHLETFPHAREVALIDVQMSTLDIFFANQQLAPPVLLKLDVQGYEAKVIDGGKATLARTRWVVAETSLRSLYEGEPLFLELVQKMREHGFRFLRPVGCLSDPRSGEVLQLDALFERP